MAKVPTNISIDDEVKAQAQKLFAELGLDLSTAVNIFLRQAIREEGIPFAINAYTPNKVTTAAIVSADNGEDCFGPFDSVDALMESLNA